MTDYVLALIPQYGLIIVFVIVTIACMGIPLPAAMLALASGGFAATGDLTLWQVIAVTFCSFLLGDQLAYWIAKSRGPKLISWMKSKDRLNPMVGKGEVLIDKHGAIAVILSRTLISPAGPWVAYICGATGFKWIAFAVAAFLGAACWTTAYVMLGYMFAGQLAQVTSLISNMLGIIIAVGGVIIGAIWLRKAWKNRLPEETKTADQI